MCACVGSIKSSMISKGVPRATRPRVIQVPSNLVPRLAPFAIFQGINNALRAIRCCLTQRCSVPLTPTCHHLDAIQNQHHRHHQLRQHICPAISPGSNPTCQGPAPRRSGNGCTHSVSAFCRSWPTTAIIQCLRWCMLGRWTCQSKCVVVAVVVVAVSAQRLPVDEVQLPPEHVHREIPRA